MEGKTFAERWSRAGEEGKGDIIDFYRHNTQAQERRDRAGSKSICNSRNVVRGPRIQLHSASSLLPTGISPPHSNRGAPGSSPTPPPRRARPLLFSRILDFKPGRPMRSDLFVFLPSLPHGSPRIHIYAGWIRKLGQFNMYCENRKLYGNTRILVARLFRFFAVYSSPPSKRIAITAAITGAFGSRTVVSSNFNRLSGGAFFFFHRGRETVGL